MRLLQNPLSLRAVAGIVAMLVLVGCQRPEVPLPENAEVDARASAATAAPVTAAGLEAAPAVVAYTAWKSCNMEQLDGHPFTGVPLSVKAGSDFVVAGFVLNEERQEIPTDIKLRVLSDGNVNAWEVGMRGRVNRPDIPQYFKLGAWAAGAGIEQLVSSTGLPPGTYHLVFTFSDGDRKLICDNGRQLTILP